MIVDRGVKITYEREIEVCGVPFTTRDVPIFMDFAGTSDETVGILLFDVDTSERFFQAGLARIGRHGGHIETELLRENRGRIVEMLLRTQAILLSATCPDMLEDLLNRELDLHPRRRVVGWSANASLTMGILILEDEDEEEEGK